MTGRPCSVFDLGLPRGYSNLRGFLSLLLTLLLAFGPLPPPARAQSGGANTTMITVSASTAAGIALASVANYQIIQNSLWRHYGDVVALAALNSVAKASANAGQPMTTAGYSTVITQLQTGLNSINQQRVSFADEAECFRYVIDSLVSNSTPMSPSSLSSALASVQNLMITQLESPLDLGRNYPADMGLPSLSGNANQFIADRVQEANDLAHNDWVWLLWNDGPGGV